MNYKRLYIPAIHTAQNLDGNVIRLYRSSLKVFIVLLIFYQISIDTRTVYSNHSAVYKNIDYIVHPTGGSVLCMETQMVGMKPCLH